jgi:tRNA modification GTPase
LHFGHFGPPPGDEVVLAHRPNALEPWFEIHSHGGQVLVEWILEQLSSHGLTIVDWTELERTRWNSWLRAAAAEALTRAMTTRAAAVLLDQYQGALEHDIRAIGGQLNSGEIEKGTNALNRLLSTKVPGLHLTCPLRVGIFGPPNAGKSSLINRMAGFERAVVSPIPGTTREMTTTVIALQGWPIELIDSPGVRDTADPLESEGVRRAKSVAAAGQCDISMWMTDHSVPYVAPPKDLAFDLTLVNKVDLPAAWSDSLVTGPRIDISATTGAGVSDFESWLVGQFTEPLTGKSGVVFSPAIAGLLEIAAQQLSDGKIEQAHATLATLLQPEQPHFPVSNNKSAAD